jgi:plastocyanin
MKLLAIIFILFVSSSSIFAKEVVVKIYKKAYIPAQITVQKGDTVIWQNREKRQYHNVWFKQFVKEEPDYLFPGDTYQYTFNKVGKFSYECGPHPMMKGVVTVVENH